MYFNTESYDDFNLDDYEQAQEVCLVLWHERPFVDNNGDFLGWSTIDRIPERMFDDINTPS